MEDLLKKVIVYPLAESDKREEERLKKFSEMLQKPLSSSSSAKIEVEDEKRQKLWEFIKNLDRRLQKVELLLGELTSSSRKSPEVQKRGAKREEINEQLLKLINQHGGQVAVIVIFEELQARGVGITTIRRAKQELGLISRKQEKIWYWRLP